MSQILLKQIITNKLSTFPAEFETGLLTHTLAYILNEYQALILCMVPFIFFVFFILMNG